MQKKALSGALVLTAVAALSACSAGRHNPEYKIVAAQDAVSATVGGNAVRDAYIVAPAAKGGTAHASVFVARLDPGADELVSATSPVAESIDITAAGQTVTSVPVSGTSSSTVSLNLTGLTKDVDATSYYPITLTFAVAGQVTLDVPVLRPGIVAPGSTTVPTVVPEVPNGSTVPLNDRPEVSSSPNQD